jgi:hypothetical protein
MICITRRKAKIATKAKEPKTEPKRREKKQSWQS